jgi:hypothetical protein
MRTRDEIERALSDTCSKRGHYAVYDLLATILADHEERLPPAQPKADVPTRETIYMPTEQEIRDEVCRNPRLTDFEPAPQESQAAPAKACNLHQDCAAADEACQEFRQVNAFHCRDLKCTQGDCGKTNKPVI